MPQSFACLHYHLIFSTKGRAPFLIGDLPDRLHAYVGGIIRNENGTLVAAGRMSDHVHFLTSLSRESSVSDVLRQIIGQPSPRAGADDPLGMSRSQGRQPPLAMDRRPSGAEETIPVRRLRFQWREVISGPFLSSDGPVPKPAGCRWQIHSGATNRYGIVVCITPTPEVLAYLLVPSAQAHFCPSPTRLRVARTALPASNPCLRLRDELGALFRDRAFADPHPRSGQPTLPLWRPALLDSRVAERRGLSSV
jgi:hypothetical protein